MYNTHIYEDLQRAYDFFNERLFSGQLPSCLITLQRKKRTMGYYSKSRFRNAQNIVVDEIALNPLHFDHDNLTEFFQTLVHEMCHLWQYHFGNPGRARYHNKEWADKMQSLGLMPSSTGLPGGRGVSHFLSSNEGVKRDMLIFSTTLAEAKINMWIIHATQNGLWCMDLQICTTKPPASGSCRPAHWLA